MNHKYLEVEDKQLKWFVKLKANKAFCICRLAAWVQKAIRPCRVKAFYIWLSSVHWSQSAPKAVFNIDLAHELEVCFLWAACVWCLHACFLLDSSLSLWGWKVKVLGKNHWWSRIVRTLGLKGLVIDAL